MTVQSLFLASKLRRIKQSQSLFFSLLSFLKYIFLPKAWIHSLIRNHKIRLLSNIKLRVYWKSRKILRRILTVKLSIALNKKINTICIRHLADGFLIKFLNYPLKLSINIFLHAPFSYKPPFESAQLSLCCSKTARYN